MKSDKEIEKLKQVMAALEAQRSALGDEVVQAAIAPLQEKLDQLRGETSLEQRKLVSVLFADLAQFTPLAGKMDPEDLHDVLNLYFSRCTTCIEEQGGVIEKFIGDAVMAVFGLSVAHEDDPQRAIQAALAIRAALGELNIQLAARYGIQLRLRVGIHTGEGVISMLGERKGQDFVVVGDMVNLASRLQTAAPPDSILISHDTYRHVRGVFDVQTLEPIQLKGVEGFIQTYLVLGIKPRAFRLVTREVEGIETRMIGRDREFNRMQVALRGTLEDGGCQVLTLRAEAGVGKSRLMYEFDLWLDLLSENIYYFKGRAQPAMQDQPYALFRDLFAFRFQIQDSDERAEVWQKMNRGIQEVLGEGEASERAAHFIGQLLSFDFHHSPHLHGMDEDPRQFQERARSYVRDYFEALSSTYPVVLLLEDLHWADDSSLDLLSQLPARLSHHRLLFLCSARPALFERRAEWGQSFPRHTLIELKPLERGESMLLVREILQKVENLPPELEEIVADSAEGNPFYVEELLKMMVEEGVILKGEEHWSLAMDRLSQARVPQTLTGVLQARFDSLTPDEKILLQRASVFGRIFWDRAVEFLGNQKAQAQEAGSRPKGSLGSQDTLNQLRSREMIFRRDTSTFEHTAEYLFKHALLRDVIYESLLRRVRRIFHAAAAGWLVGMTERNRRADEFAAIIAGHYEGAEAFEQAAVWYQQAGERAAARFANAEAVRLLSRALRLTPEEETTKRYTILLAREKVYELQGNWQGQAQDLEVLDDLAEKLDGSGEGIGLSGLSHRAEIALRRASLAEWRGDFPGAVAAAQQAVSLSTSAGFLKGEIAGYLAWSRALARQGDYTTARTRLEGTLTKAVEFPRLQAAILRHLGVIKERQGNYVEAIDHYEKALLLFRQVQDRRGESNALNDLGASLFYQGEFSRAADYFEQALSSFREIGDLRMESVMLTNLGSISYSQGAYAKTSQYYAAALQIDRETGDRSGECLGLNNLGRVTLEQRNFTAALSYLESGLRLSREIQEPYNESMALDNLGVFYLITGEQEAAEAHLKQALEIYRMTEDRQGESTVLAFLGLLSNHKGEPKRAEKLCQEAQSIATEIGARDILAKIMTILGHAQFGSGEIEKAKMAYRRALDLRGELGQVHLMPEPRAGLAQASLIQGDFSEALNQVRKILEHLESGTLDGADEAAWVYLTCYQVLHVSGDPLAGEVLEAGYALLTEGANSLEDKALRQAFLQNNPANRELLAAWDSRMSP